MNGKTALLAGATGLVGTKLLAILLKESNYEKVYVLVRKLLNVKCSKLIEIMTDFRNLERVQQHFAVDDVFCCLGTTLKKAGSKEAMYLVDVEYPFQLAKLTEQQGAKQFLQISSMNANPHSLLWYPKMKGELEEKIKLIPFQSMAIIRPSLLLGKRNEHRLMEELASTLIRGLNKMTGKVNRRLAIDAEEVALAMFSIAQMNRKGIAVYSSEQLGTFAKR
ncbi:NAD-dependent epimerase/dehydratase family protein [Halalkalibacter urbisdiaboli]|uniref:NAD-dependent epimerase/dehydratase family protein n=1 Tax=Halalkalibacter urbisdiaboli TaxID=1960589 RepID=UPI000B452E76|nr:NAD-dependent epimerase/dehydratase family protein [Halalkalibacter urbisdiaboli]